MKKIKTFVNFILIKIAYYILQRKANKFLVNENRPTVIYAFDDIGHLINLEGAYENRELIALKKFLVCNNMIGGYFIDVGAHIGNHTIFLSNLFDKTISFEPNKKTFKLLELNLASYGGAEAINKALGSKNENAYMDINLTNRGASRITMKPTDNIVEITTLDSFSKEHQFFSTAVPQAPVVKIDVEGHEMNVLEGGQQFIREYKPVIIFEQHAGYFMNGTSLVINKLKEFGYQNFYSTNISEDKIKNRYLRTIQRAFSLLLFGDSLEYKKITHFTSATHPMVVATFNNLNER